MAASNARSKSLKEYLKRYESNNEEDKKKKKKKKKVKPDALGVRVLDEDPVWQKPVQLEEEDNDSADEEKPQVNEDIEVKRMKRLEQLRSRRPYNVIAEDGSGWVSLSPKHENSVNPNSDISPPRRQRTRNDTPSPEPQERPMDPGREDTDLSPPPQQQGRHHTSPDLDIKLGHFNDPSSDLSPPHKQRSRKDTPSPSPGFKPSREDKIPSHLIGQNADISPPRRRHAQTSENFDRKKSDISPSRRALLNSPQQDDACASPESDLSPPRKSRKESSEPASTKKRLKGGLFTRSDIMEDNSRTKSKDFLSFQQMDPSMSGRGAEAVYRDKKTGNRMSNDEYLKLKQKVEENPKKQLEWGKGLAQKREAEARLQELELEKDMPFARTRDDPELDKMLKERLRWGDPMAHLVKKKHYEPGLADLGDNEKMKESGFIIPQDIPIHSWIRRGLDAAPNRYGIKPGRHWDGVDRSNGFEKQMFKRLNEKQATEREAYLWSVSDM